MDFSYIGRGSVLHSVHDLSFKILSFVNEFLD